MAGPTWIKGKSIDSQGSRECLEMEAHPKFQGYLVHLTAPACTIVVGRKGLSEEVRIPSDPNAGFFYQNSNSGMELIVLQWHGRPLDDASQIIGLLYEAASELICDELDLHVAAPYEMPE